MYEFSACPALWSACLTLLIGHTKTLCSLTFLDAAMIRFASNAGGGFSAGSRSSNLGDLYAESRHSTTGLVLSCIEAKFCKKICVGKLSPRSTQCTPLHLSLISIFSLKIAELFADFLQNAEKIARILLNFY